MPELPDLVVWVPALARALVGRRIAAARVRDPIVLRVAVPGTLPELVAGRAIEAVERRGHHVRVALGARGGDGPLCVIMNLMLSGKLVLADAAPAKDPKALCFAWTLDDGRELHYVDDTRMGKVWLVDAAGEAQVPGFGDLGVDVLGAGFTRVAFRALARRRKDQVRAFLMDKTALASIGNAYADEILFAAGVHPKTWVRSLDAAGVDRLHAAIGRVLDEAAGTIRAREARPGEKIRDFLAVRGRKGEPCRACGATIRTTQVHGHETCFCPTCQPATRSSLVDWGKLASAERAAAGAGADAAPAATAGVPRAPASRTRRRPPARRR